MLKQFCIVVVFGIALAYIEAAVGVFFCIAGLHSAETDFKSHFH